MQKLIYIIDFMKVIVSGDPNLSVSKIYEALIEDFDIEGYITGEWGQDYLSMGKGMRFKFILLEFMNIYNSLEKIDQYELKSENDLFEDLRFKTWKQDAIWLLPIIKDSIQKKL